MASQLNPYISFADGAREAMEFYKTVFGGTLELRTFEEYGAAEDLADATKIMHSRLVTPNGLVILAADTATQMGKPPEGSNISLLLEGSNEAELRGYWDRLCEGGKVAVELAPQLWGDLFGMCVDKYGIAWMVNVHVDDEEGLAV